MSAKILDKAKSYQPVTIELTFDTLEQLECFYKIYESPYETIDVRSIDELFDIIDQHK